MRLQTKRTLLQIATATALVCTAAVIFLPLAASAQPIASHALGFRPRTKSSRFASGRDLQTWLETGWGRCASRGAPLVFLRFLHSVASRALPATAPTR